MHSHDELPSTAAIDALKAKYNLAKGKVSVVILKL